MPDTLPTLEEFRRMAGMADDEPSLQAVELPSLSEFRKMAGLEEPKPEPDSLIAGIAKKAAAETTPGLALRAMGAWDYEEQDLGLIPNTIAGIGGFLLDPLTYVSGGVGGALGKQAGKRLAAGYGRTMLEHGIQGAVQLGGLELGRDPLRQYIHEGEVSPMETAANVARGATLGASFGPLAPITGPARIAAGGTLLGVGDPLLRGELPTWETLLSGFATEIGLRSVNALVKLGAEGRRKLIEARNGRRQAGFEDASPSSAEFRELGLEELADKPRAQRNAAVDAAEAIESFTESTKPRERMAPEGKEGLEVGKPETPEQAKATAEQLSRELGIEVTPVTETQNVREAQRTQATDPATLRQQEKEGGKPPETEAAPGATQEKVGSSVALKNEVTEAQRAEMGLPPAMEPLRQSDQVIWNRAMRELEQNPNRADTLIAELTAKPRPAEPVENMILLHRDVELWTERAKASAAAEVARQRGDDVAQAAYDAQVSTFNTKLDELFNVIESSGTEAGRSFRLRRLWAAEDYSLQGTSRQMRLATEGKPTDAEMKTAERTAEEYKKTQERLDSVEPKEATLEAGHRAVQDITKKVTKKQAKRAEKARKELDEELKRHLGEYGGSLFSTEFLDPKWIASMTRVAGAYVKLGVATFQDFLATLRTRFGSEKVKEAEPSLKRAWDSAVSAAKPKPKREIKTDRQLSKHARDLAEFHVERGVRRLKDLLDAVHADLRRIDPSITRRTALEAFSGYGIFTPAPTDELKRTLYDLRRQGQEVAKLQDIKEGQPPLKTGKGRPEPSETERQLSKRVRAKMKQAGFEARDADAELKSALASTKTRLRNRIADLSRAIKTKTPIVRRPGKDLSDAEVAELTRHRDALQKQYDELFGRRGRELTDEERVKRAIALERRLVREYNRRAAAGEFGPKPKRGVPLTPEYQVARAERMAAKAQYEYLRDAANPKKTPEQRAEAAYHANLRRRIAEYERRIAEKEFEPKPRRLPPSDSESELLRARLDSIKREFIREVERARRKRRTPIEKVFGLIPESANAARAMLTSLDFSAVLRQGGFLFAAHPIRSSKAMPDMFRAFVSERGMDRAFRQIADRPNSKNGLYKRSGLEFTDPHGPLSRMEEAFMSRWAERIPGVAGSQRAYITFLNRVRADSFDAMAATVGKARTISDPESKVVANFVNAATGRGNLWKFTQASTAAATVFFAPRYVVSRFQILTLQPLWRGNLSTRTAIVKEYARALTGLGVFYGMSSFALNGLIGPPGDEWDIELDSRSSDFGKIRIGPTRIDPLAGFQQAAVLMERLRTGEVKTLKGRIRKIRGKVPYGSDDAVDVIARFLRTKLSPPIAISMDVLAGKNVVGEPVTPTSVARGATIPLAFQDIYESMIAQGVPAGTALGILSIFGMNIATYEE